MIELLTSLAQLPAETPAGELWFARGWAAALALALIAASIIISFVIYRRAGAAGRGVRIGLGLLRALALVLLVVIFLQPSVGLPQTAQTRRNVVVLVDASQSMGVRDTRKTDHQIAEAALAAGRLPFDTAAAQAELAKAIKAMRQAQRRLAAGRREPALQHQRDAEAALNVAVESLAQIQSPLIAGGSGRPSVQLERLIGRQAGLREQVTSISASGGGWPQIAQRQGQLADDVNAMARRLIVSPAPLTTAQREQMSSVSRLEMVQQLLSDTQRATMQRLGRNHQLHYYRFADGLVKIGRNGSDAMSALGEIEPGGEATHLAGAIQQAVGAHAGPVAGLIILTDGVATGGGSPIEVARRLGERGISVHPVAIGLPEPDDVSIESVVVQEVAFEGDTVPIRVQIRSRGYEKRQTFLSAYLNGRRVARESVMLTGRAQFEDLFFDVKGVSDDSAELEITIEAFADEATDRNNRVVRSLRVVDEKINVLYIEGSARWEYRYLRAILLRDPRLDVKFISTRADAELARSSQRYLARFPEDPEQAFAFDLVILGDVDPEFFRPEELNRLEQLVRERGGSLLMLAGRGHAPVDYGDTPIEDMLPVTFDAGAEWDEVGDEAHPVVTPAGRHSMVMGLGDTARQNDLLWARVKQLRQVPPIVDAKPGAVVLAELSDIGPRGNRTPLIAWQRYGTGKSMFIGTDRLWRLRLKTGDRYHWRMWSQTIQFLTLSRLLGENRRVMIETDRIVYHRDQRVQIFASVVDEAFKPVLSPTYRVHVRDAAEDDEPSQTVTLKPEPGRPGLFSGYFAPDEQGRYQVLAPRDQRPVANTAEFHVSALQQEMRMTGVQQDELDRIAEVSGGQSLAIGQMPALPVLLDEQPIQISYVRQKSLWDTWPVLVAFMAMTGAEWFFRRRHDMA